MPMKTKATTVILRQLYVTSYPTLPIICLQNRLEVYSGSGMELEFLVLKRKCIFNLVISVEYIFILTRNFYVDLLQDFQLHPNG